MKIQICIVFTELYSRQDLVNRQHFSILQESFLCLSRHYKGSQRWGGPWGRL